MDHLNARSASCAPRLFQKPYEQSQEDGLVQQLKDFAQCLLHDLAALPSSFGICTRRIGWRRHRIVFSL